MFDDGSRLLSSATPRSDEQSSWLCILNIILLIYCLQNNSTIHFFCFLPKLGLLRFGELPSAIASRKDAPAPPPHFHLPGSRRYSQYFTHFLSTLVARPNTDVRSGRAKEGSRQQQCDVLPWRRAAFQSGIPRGLARSSPGVSSRAETLCSASSPTDTVLPSSNRIFFVYLRGTIAADAVSADALTNGKLRITSQAALDSGETQDPQTYEVPLKTASLGQHAHLSIRNATGITDCLTPGQNDILTDYWIPGMFLQTGLWTFQVEGVLEDGRHLFCMSLTQRLEHANL